MGLHLGHSTGRRRGLHRVPDGCWQGWSPWAERHVRAAPPAIEPGLWGDHIEVGAVGRIAGRYYMLIGVGSSHPLGARHLSSLLAGESGMYVAVSGAAAGPYRVDQRQRILLGSSPRLYTYFARFYRCGDEMLLNHHTVPREWRIDGIGPEHDVYLAPLKRVAVDAEGMMSLRWWPGNEALKGTSRPALLEGCGLHVLRPEDCPIESGNLLMVARAGGLVVLPSQHDPTRGVILEADVLMHRPLGQLWSVGFFVEGQARHNGTLIVAQSDGRVTVGSYNGYAYRPEDAKPRALALGETSHWRLLLRDAYLELYIDDEFIQAYSLSHKPGGRLGFAVEAGEATVTNVRLWEMSA
jgi:hypothetical protein